MIPLKIGKSALRWFAQGYFMFYGNVSRCFQATVATFWLQVIFSKETFIQGNVLASQNASLFSIRFHCRWWQGHSSTRGLFVFLDSKVHLRGKRASPAHLILSGLRLPGLVINFLFLRTGAALAPFVLRQSMRASCKCDFSISSETPALTPVIKYCGQQHRR